MLTRASTYTDAETAQRFVQAVVDLHTITIREWLAHDSSERLKLDGYFPSQVTGRVQLRGMLYASRGPVDVHGVRVILRRAPERPNGFVVLSSFPTLS